MKWYNFALVWLFYMIIRKLIHKAMVICLIAQGEERCCCVNLLSDEEKTNRSKVMKSCKQCCIKVSEITPEELINFHSGLRGYFRKSKIINAKKFWIIKDHIGFNGKYIAGDVVKMVDGILRKGDGWGWVGAAKKVGCSGYTYRWKDSNRLRSSILMIMIIRFTLL